MTYLPTRRSLLATAIAVACSSPTITLAQDSDSDSDSDDNTLPTLTVTGEHVHDATTADTGSYTSNRVTIGKREQSLRETPQSVSVITRERMNDQNMTTLDDVLTQTTGITRRSFGPTASTFRSRGYEIDTLLLDGSPIDSAIGVTDTMFDTAVMDRVEVLRGPAGLIQVLANPVVPSIWCASVPKRSSVLKQP